MEYLEDEEEEKEKKENKNKKKEKRRWRGRRRVGKEEFRHGCCYSQSQCRKLFFAIVYFFKLL